MPLQNTFEVNYLTSLWHQKIEPEREWFDLRKVAKRLNQYTRQRLIIALLESYRSMIEGIYLGEDHALV